MPDAVRLMRIAQIAPLSESCPPALYGGTERVVSYLTEELVAMGHEVTLFASGDSTTGAELVPITDRALRLHPSAPDPLAFHMIMLEEVLRRVREFDILHFHIDLMHAPVVRAFAERTLTTLHGRLDLPQLQPFYRTFPHLPLVSISDAQRRPLPPVNWLGTVHHGLPAGLLPFSPRADGGYLAFLGRISPEKRPDRAIEIAVRAGMPLKMAAKVDRVDRPYWETCIEPLVRAHAGVEFIGEISDREKPPFLGEAAALLFPIDWEEPFGLVMIEAMACGTPVIAFNRGSVPEIVENGRSGFIVNNVEQAIAAVEHALALPRHGVRDRFESRFTVGRMAGAYLDIYRTMRQRSASPETQAVAV